MQGLGLRPYQVYRRFPGITFNNANLKMGQIWPHFHFIFVLFLFH